jgi:hypothetical protein
MRISSMIAYLRTVLRVPVRQIQAYLETLHHFKISTGEIVEVLHRLHHQMQPQVEEILAAIRASPASRPTRRGWREDGQNGYIWSVSTPQKGYYEYHHSLGSEVVKQLPGESFEGVLGSDFYASDNIYQ